METTHYTIGQLTRLKNSIPFSDSLNAYIRKQFEDLKQKLNITFVDGQPYKTHLEMFSDIESGNLKISKDYSDCTIFGNPEVNQMFRAVHDYRHYIHQKDFSVAGELTLNYLHMQECQSHGLSQFDLTLLQIEMAGQVIFYESVKDFPTNQRNYTIVELIKYGY